MPIIFCANKEDSRRSRGNVFENDRRQLPLAEQFLGIEHFNANQLLAGANVERNFIGCIGNRRYCLEPHVRQSQIQGLGQHLFLLAARQRQPVRQHV